MKCLYKMIITTITMLLFILPVYSTTVTEIQGLPVLGEAEWPKDWEFSVSDSCSIHESFTHATAREDGWFAICGWEPDGKIDLSDFRANYFVDVFNEQGVFQMELNIRCLSSFFIELTETTLYLYFDCSILSYNLETGEKVYYETPDYAAVESSKNTFLKDSKFTSGPWTYTCSPFGSDHQKLTRTNGSERQVLISFSSSYKSSFNIVFQSIILSVIGLFAFVKIRKHKQKK